MLSTSNISANQAETYYTREDASAAEPEQIFARWLGQGAMTLSLPVRVEPEVFQSLLRGFSPAGQALFGRSVGAAKRRAATDYTFSAPKSVSIAALVQQDGRVLQAHQRAIEQSLSVMEERYAQARISTSTGQQYTPTDNLIAAVFTHTTSREMEPQLHSHCVVINATRLPDGRWYSFSNEAAIAHQKLLGQIYQNELAVSLQRLGYQIEPRSQGQFELTGYSLELLQLFSTRRQQILALLEEWERKGVQILDSQGNVNYDPRSRREAAALQSRKHKARAIDSDKLVKGWNALVKLKGLELPPVPQGAIAVLKTSHEPIKAVIAAAIQRGSEAGGFRQTQLEQFVLEHHIGTWSFDEIQQAIAEHLTEQTIAPQEVMPQQISEPAVGDRSTLFHDAISRARQQRMLYATRVVEPAQPRNFSPLTFSKQVNADVQTSKTATAFLDHPAFSGSAEYGDHERLEPASAVDATRAEPTAASCCSTPTGDTAVEQQLATLARSLDESLEPLAEAIADHHAEQCFVECAGELAAAVAAVDQGVEYLEQSAQARSEFAAAVARLHAAARSEARRLERRLMEARQRRERSPQSISPSTKERYQQMWQRYRQDIQMNSPLQLDVEVARRAFVDGQSRKAIALMLVAGSGYVKQMERSQGKAKVMVYVQQTARVASLSEQAQPTYAIFNPRSLQLG